MENQALSRREEILTPAGPRFSRASVSVRPERSPARYVCAVTGGGAQRTGPRQDGGQPGEGTRAWTLKFGESGLGTIDRAGCVALGSVHGVFRLPLHAHSPPFTPLSVLLGLALGELPGKMEEREVESVFVQLLPYGVVSGCWVLPPKVTGPLKPPPPHRLSPPRSRYPLRSDPGGPGWLRPGPRTHYSCCGRVTP